MCILDIYFQLADTDSDSRYLINTLGNSLDAACNICESFYNFLSHGGLKGCGSIEYIDLLIGLEQL